MYDRTLFYEVHYPDADVVHVPYIDLLLITVKI